MNPPCFAEQNATAFAGAEDFTPCFAEQNANPLVSRGFYSLFCGAKCEPSGEQRILLLVYTNVKKHCLRLFSAI